MLMQHTLPVRVQVFYFDLDDTVLRFKDFLET